MGHIAYIGILHGENFNPSQSCEGASGNRKTCRKFTMGLICDVLTMHFNVRGIDHRSHLRKVIYDLQDIQQAKDVLFKCTIVLSMCIVLLLFTTCTF